jgi:predicted esterase
MLMGREDATCEEAHARKLYALIEGPNTEFILYDAGHTLPVEFVADAIAFVATHY